MRRKREKDLGDLTNEEYALLKIETEEYIEKNYSPQSIVEVVKDHDGYKKGTLGLCFLDVHTSAATMMRYVETYIMLTTGDVILVGRNIFDRIIPTGKFSEDMNSWIVSNVNESRRRTKRNA